MNELTRYIPFKYRKDLFYTQGFEEQLAHQRNFHPGSWNTFTPEQKATWQKGARMAVLASKRHAKRHVQCWDCEKVFTPVAGERVCGCSNDHSVVRMKSPDKSWSVKRTIYKHSELERAFAREWIDECVPRSWLNFGHGLLQDLFMIEGKWPRWPVALFIVNPRERMVAATVVQWLGTSCGMCFLRKVLESCGYVIVKKEEKQ